MSAAASSGRGKAVTEPAAGAGTWVLQADAATRTGYSVSAIRKWRRAGLVADRKRTTAGGLERVEVRLEDVQARLAEQPPERPRPAPPAPDSGPPAGSAIIPISDLEALFERAQGAERRATQAETRLQAAEVEARFMSGQLAELRRQVHAAGAAAAAAEAAGAAGAAGPTAAVAAATNGRAGPSPPERTTRPESREQTPTDRPEPVTTERPANVVGGASGASWAAPGTSPTDDGPRRSLDRLTASRATIDLLGLDLGDMGPLVSPVTRRPPPGAPLSVPAPAPASAPARTHRPAAVAAPAPPPPDVAPVRSVRLSRPTAPPPAPAPAPIPVPARATPRPGPSTPHGAPGRDRSQPGREAEIGNLASELRRLYAKLDGYRREPTISRARERQRERDLGDYDTALLRACSALGVPTGLRAGEPVGIERRAALTKHIARAGIDVRASTGVPPPGDDGRWPS